MSNETVEKLKRACLRYKETDLQTVLRNGLVTAEMHKDHVVSAFYLHRKLSNTTEFINYYKGSSCAMHDGLIKLVADGVLRELTRNERLKYGTLARLFEVL